MIPYSHPTYPANTSLILSLLIIFAMFLSKMQAYDVKVTFRVQHCTSIDPESQVGQLCVSLEIRDEPWQQNETQDQKTYVKK